MAWLWLFSKAGRAKATVKPLSGPGLAWPILAGLGSAAGLRPVGISRGWALPLGSRVGVPAGTGTGQGPDTRALANGLIFSQNG